jgi:hypothetical protein
VPHASPSPCPRKGLRIGWTAGLRLYRCRKMEIGRRISHAADVSAPPRDSFARCRNKITVVLARGLPPRRWPLTTEPAQRTNSSPRVLVQLEAGPARQLSWQITPARTAKPSQRTRHLTLGVTSRSLGVICPSSWAESIAVTALPASGTGWSRVRWDDVHAAFITHDRRPGAAGRTLRQVSGQSMQTRTGN